MVGAIAGVAACLVAPAPAGASSVGVEFYNPCFSHHEPFLPPCYEYHANFRAEPTDRNMHVTAAVTPDGRLAHFHDDGGNIQTELPACYPVPFESATCDVRLVLNTDDSSSQRQFTAVGMTLGAGDDVLDTTEVRGGRFVEAFAWDGDDVFTGGPRTERVAGAAGSDRLYGRGGDDFLSGGIENVNGFSDGEPDLLEGGEGNDELRDWAGPATLRGGAGDDTIHARDRAHHAPDHVDCGSGADVAHVDTDDVTVGCETVLVG